MYHCIQLPLVLGRAQVVLFFWQGGGDDQEVKWDV